MERDESFTDYLVRMRKCRTLPKYLRELAADKLKERYERRNGDPDNSRIHWCHMHIKPFLYGMFEWEHSPEGSEFWRRVADAGF
jgi:hypothetical protein